MYLAPNLTPPTYEQLVAKANHSDLVKRELEVQRQITEIQQHLKDTLPLGATRAPNQQPVDEVEDEGESEEGDDEDEDGEGDEDAEEDSEAGDFVD